MEEVGVNRSTGGCDVRWASHTARFAKASEDQKHGGGLVLKSGSDARLEMCRSEDPKSGKEKQRGQLLLGLALDGFGSSHLKDIVSESKPTHLKRPAARVVR